MIAAQAAPFERSRMYVWRAAVFLVLGYFMLSQEMLTSDPCGEMPVRSVLQQMRDYASTMGRAPEWKLFGATRLSPARNRLGVNYQRPIFTPAVRILDGHTITLNGFMFPLGEMAGQDVFLFGPFPANCPYQYHVNPNMVIEVHADQPVRFTYDVLKLTGTLRLVADDPENGVFYQLTHARQVE